MPALRPVLILMATLGLAACGGASEKKEKDQRTAAGEILPGSVSDAMPPYDTVRSQPPLAPKETPKPGATAKDAASDDAEPGMDAEPADTAAAPAEAPAPAPTPE